MTRGSFIFLVLFALSHFLESEEIADVRSLESMEDQNRFNSLLLIYRCPKCQSSSLSGSDAPIAKDLKGQIKRLIEEGYFQEECSHCKYNEVNLMSEKVCLGLDFIDGDTKNCKLDNIRLLCPNCYLTFNGSFSKSKLFCK